MSEHTKQKETRWILADLDILPDVFEKVLEAKQYLASGTVETAVEAAHMAGLSRSAFYKYKDSIFAYQEGASGQLLTAHLLLHDKPGVLSQVLIAYAEAGANILTVNQNIPADGAASVSISARIDGLSMTTEEFVGSLQTIRGVQKVTRLVVSRGEI